MVMLRQIDGSLPKQSMKLKETGTGVLLAFDDELLAHVSKATMI